MEQKPLDQHEFRDPLGHFPTGVTEVTARTDEGRTGDTSLEGGFSMPDYAHIASGKPVLIEVAGSRATVGYLVAAAEQLDTPTASFIIERTDGFLCVAVEGAELDRLHLPPMTEFSEAIDGLDYAVSVDAIEGVGTGISAHDRATTVRALANPLTTPGMLSRPGHVLPIRAGTGCSSSKGIADIAVSLMRWSGLRPAAVFAAVLDEYGNVASHRKLADTARRHGIPLLRGETKVGPQEQYGTFRTAHGSFRTYEYLSPVDGSNRVAVTRLSTPAG